MLRILNAVFFYAGVLAMAFSYYETGGNDFGCAAPFFFAASAIFGTIRFAIGRR